MSHNRGHINKNSPPSKPGQKKEKIKTSTNIVNQFPSSEKEFDCMQEENIEYGKKLVQAQENLNIQLLLRRQKNFSDTFKSCYNAMQDYLKNPKNSKGNFLWTLESFCSMVNLWKKDYPNYEPQLSKEFNKEKIKFELKDLSNKSQNNKNYDPKLFDKFYHLVNMEKQNFEDDEIILSHFPEVKPNESNVMSNAKNLLDINRKVEMDDEKEEFYGFPNFDVDPKIKDLRHK